MNRFKIGVMADWLGGTFRHNIETSAAMGAQGVISVAANVVPRQMARLTHAMLEGDLPAARREHTRLLPLMHELFASVSPIPLKAALAALGLCENEVRLPLVPQRATQELLTALFAALE